MPNRYFSDTIPEVVKAAPPVTVGAATLLNITVQDWVLILTIVYLLLQITMLLKKEFFKRKGKQDVNSE